jgi:hypothetical protein
MNGLNGLFKGNPIAFMQEHILHPNPGWSNSGGILDQRDLITGIQSFDILPPTETANLYNLKFWDRGASFLHEQSVLPGTFTRTMTPAFQPTFWSHAKAFIVGGDSPQDSRRSDESPIRAYWVPFRMNRTYELQLGTEANFMFTAGLSGCSVVVSGDPQRPTVAHINRMNGPELEHMIQKYNPQYATPTKAETTQRQIMLQELKSVVAARNAGLGAVGKIPRLRGVNYGKNELNPWALNPRHAIDVGGPRRQGTGNLIFGVCDFEHHYNGPSEFDCLAQVTGVRNMNTGNWRFYYQRLSSGKSKLGPYIYERGTLQCIVCKTSPDRCVCPA